MNIWIKPRAALLFVFLLIAAAAQAQSDPLSSWSDGPAKQAILNFVHTTTDSSNAKYVAPEKRFAVFDQDGTIWVEHPLYTQMVFAFDRVHELAPQHPEWKTTGPFKSVIAGDRAAMSKFSMKDFEAIFAATLSGMSVGDFQKIAQDWLAKAEDQRWHKPYTQLIYQPMLEVLQYLRTNGYRTYIVTGGGQDFVRAYAEPVYGIPPEQIVGSALATDYTYNSQGEGILMRPAKVLLDNNNAGKAEDIYLFIGQHPQAAFGNSTGDQQMLEYTQAGGPGNLMMLVLHDDAQREYAYGPAAGLPATDVGTFTPALYDEAKARGWTVISMKNDWKRIFSWEK
jgi:phosphoserine phosphatase